MPTQIVRCRHALAALGLQFQNAQQPPVAAGNGKALLTGLGDLPRSLYPYMVKNRDFKLVRKILLIFEPLIFLFCAAVFIWAEPICVLLFGDRKSTRLNSSHSGQSRMPSSA